MVAKPKPPNLVRATIHGTLWSYTTTYSAKFLVFISTIILARLLVQEDYGVAGYALVIMSFIDFLQGLGIGEALVYYERVPERTNTAFWLSVAAGVSLTFLAYFVAAPLGGWFFDDPRAVDVTRVLSFSLLISALGQVHEYLLIKELAFKRKFVPEFARALMKGAVSIGLALMGWGPWSLIWGQLAGAAVSTIVFWFIIPWRPHLHFNKTYAKSLLRYGFSIISNSGTGILILNLDYLLIGHYMGAAALGIYTLGFRMPELLIKEFSGVIGKVIFPIYVKMRDGGKRLSRGFLMTLQYVNLITVPLGLGLALVSKPFVLVAFTDKWVEAIPVMAAISLYSLLRAMVFNVSDAYKAEGKPEILTRIHIVQVIISVPVLWWAASVHGTITAVAWSQVVLSLFAAIFKLIIAARILSISIIDIFKALQSALLAGTLMTLAVLAILWLTDSWTPLLQLILSVFVGGITYMATLWFLDRAVLLEARRLVQSNLLKK